MEISGSTSAAFGGQTFGAAVVSATLDTMNGVSQASAAPFDKQTFGAAVVDKTLDYMNSGNSGGGMDAASYDFQTSVLGAAYSPVGNVLDSIA